MPSISKYQQDHCKLAQLSQAFTMQYVDNDEGPAILERILLEIDDVNLQILSDKTGKCCFIGGTPLHIASHRKHIKAFKALLRRGADFTIKNNNGDTALHCLFYNMLPHIGELENTKGTLQNPLIKSLLRAHVESANTKNPCSADGLSHFHIACASNHLKAAELFLNSGVSVNGAVNIDSSTFPGCTPLHLAVKWCGYKTAKLLLERGANVNAKDTKGLTPLHVVVERNLMLILHKFFQSEKDKKELEQLNKYLRKNERIIKLFLTDSHVMHVDEVGFSKLHAACTLSDTTFVKTFMKDVNINCAIHMDSPIRPGYTALHFAVQFNIEIVELLLKSGAYFEAKDRKEVTPFDLFKEMHGVETLYDTLTKIPAIKKILFSDNRTKLTDFIYATWSRSTLQEFFQSKPTDLYLPKNCPVWPGYCLSHMAVLFSKNDPFFIPIAKDASFCPTEIYFKCGGKTVIPDVHGRTPLHLAYYQQRETIIDLFFEREFGLVDVIDIDGLSHLHIACKRENINAVLTLLSTGADVNRVFRGRTITTRFQRLASGSTPLHIAMEIPNFEIIKMLLEHGADVNAIDVNGMTPLHQFIHLPRHNLLNKQKVIKEIGHLVFSACDLKNIICSKNGLSHLHFASLTGNKDAVERILKLGADPNGTFLCDKNIDSPECNPDCYKGLTPLHFSLEILDVDIMDLLLRNGADLLLKKPNGMALFYDSLNHNTCFKTTIEIDISIKKALASILVKEAAFRKRVKDDSGLTPLHTACFLRDGDQIKKLLTDSRDEVNAQMHADSPMWPKATPLHLLIGSKYGIEDLDHTIKLLLDSGANITSMDDEGDTPLHKIWRNQEMDSGRQLLRLLLRYQTDFSINPINKEGISHFHLACMLGEYTIVEKFLENGIDVNLPIDYRRNQITFQTPLQFMMRSKEFDAMDAESHLKTMDVLLKYGADVNAPDENGSSPLLEVAYFGPWQKLFFQKLHKAGVDMNSTDLRGYSVLQIFLYSMRRITNENIQILFGCPNLFNSFNSSNGIGILSKIIDEDILFPNRKIILDAIMENPSVFIVNSLGQTPIHNIVADPKSAVSAFEYEKYIERFIKLGFNIDAQDSTGKTALHLAAYFHNEEALCGLLIAGADINVTDMYNQTLFANIFKFNKRRRNSAPLPRRDKLRLKNKIACYIIAMQQCGLEVSSENLKWANGVLSRGKLRRHRKTILEELEDTKLVKIGTGSLFLRNFLSETGAVASRPSMMCDDREAVDKFFELIDNERFPHLIYLFKLQYRKMLKRLPLMEAATYSVREILGSVNGFSMPEMCCRMILRFLTNTEVENLILSTSLN